LQHQKLLCSFVTVRELVSAGVWQSPATGTRRDSNTLQVETEISIRQPPALPLRLRPIHGQDGQHSFGPFPREVARAGVKLMCPFQVGKGLLKDDKAKKLALQHWLEAMSVD